MPPSKSDILPSEDGITPMWAVACVDQTVRAPHQTALLACQRGDVPIERNWGHAEEVN